MFRDTDPSLFKVLQDNDNDNDGMIQNIVKQFLKSVNILCIIKMSTPFV